MNRLRLFDGSVVVDLQGLKFDSALTLLHSKQPKLHRVLAVLSAVGLNMSNNLHCITPSLGS